MVTSKELTLKVFKQAEGIELLRLWRNNIGLMKTPHGKVYRFGLPKGSADLIGIMGGFFVAIEVKGTGDTVKTNQKKFLKMVDCFGGIAGVVNTENIGGFALWITKEYRIRAGAPMPST